MKWSLSKQCLRTYQIFRDRNLLIQNLHARPDLHILPHGVIQRLQARLVPEQLRNVEHVAHQVDITPKREEPPSELERVFTRERQHACRRELGGNRARSGGGEDPVREGFVVREERGLRECVCYGQLEEMRMGLECYRERLAARFR